MKPSGTAIVKLAGEPIEYRLVRSPSARKLRIRVGPAGVEVVQPAGRSPEDASVFLRAHGKWVRGQLARVARLRSLRRPAERCVGEILLSGRPTTVRVLHDPRRRCGNRVTLEHGSLVVRCGNRAAGVAFTA